MLEATREARRHFARSPSKTMPDDVSVPIYCWKMCKYFHRIYRI